MAGLDYWRREGISSSIANAYHKADICQALPILKAAYDMGVNTVSLSS